MSELEYDQNFGTWLTNAGITPTSNPINIRGTIKLILSNMLTATLPAIISAANLPTSDPHVAGRLWVNTGGVVTRSRGLMTAYGDRTYGSGFYGGIGPLPPIIETLCTFLTPQVRDRPPYLPNSSPREYGLMRHFENRLRGVLVWEVNDGTYVVDTPCNYEAAQTQPAAYLSDDPIGPDLTADFEGLTNSNAAYPWNPFPGSTNSTIPGSFAYNVNWDQTTQDFILDPYNINWWEGGALNIVTQEQALALTMAGFGDCIGQAEPGADPGSQPQGLGPYGSSAING